MREEEVGEPSAGAGAAFTPPPPPPPPPPPRPAPHPTEKMFRDGEGVCPRRWWLPPELVAPSPGEEVDADSIMALKHLLSTGERDEATGETRGV